MINEALNELSHLNQRHALRHQWALKNVLSAKYTRSGSLSSSSSTGSQSASVSTSTASSFSSSLSCESWDSFSDSTDVSMASRPSVDCPRVRRLSKPKLNLYRPYSKPRRFSLQLVSHPESPEVADDLSVAKQLSGQLCSGPLTPPKYSRLVSAEKENCINMKVKSNPTSPSKCESLTAVLLDAHDVLDIHDMRDKQLLSMSTLTNTSLAPVSSMSAHYSAIPTTDALLVRSKSLDDLSCVASNACCMSHITGNHSSNSSTLFLKQSTAMASASSCDIDNVLQRISTLQV